jgi:hypothetical protein
MLVGYPVNSWCIRGTVTTTAGTPLTAVQYEASSTNEARILAINVSQSGSNNSAMEQVRIVRKTAAATVTAGAVGTNIFDLTGNSTNGAGTFRGTLSTSATGVVATAEGTDGDIDHQFNFNVLTGYTKDFQPENGIWVPASGIIALKLKAVAALTYDCELWIQEVK